jgi:hypothetical protein
MRLGHWTVTPWDHYWDRPADEVEHYIGFKFRSLFVGVTWTVWGD